MAQSKQCLNACCYVQLDKVKSNSSDYPNLFCSKKCEQDKVRNMLQALTLQQCVDLPGQLEEYVVSRNKKARAARA